MAEAGELLSHDEQGIVRDEPGFLDRLIEQGKPRIEQVRVLAAVAELAQSLDLSPEASNEIVASFRVRLDGVPFDSVEDLGRTINNLVAIIPQADTARLLLAQEQTAIALPLDTSEKLDNSLDAKGLHYVESIVGALDDLSFTTSDAERIADALIEMAGPRRSHERAMDMRQAIIDRLHGTSVNDLAGKLGKSPSNISMTFSYFKKKIEGRYDKHAIVERFRALMQIVEEVGKTPLPPINNPHHTEQETVSPIRLAEELAERIGLGKELTAALREFLSPNGNTSLSKNKRMAADALANYVDTTFGGIENANLGLTNEQKTMLRKLTGRWYQRAGSTIDVPQQPSTLARIIINTQTSRQRANDIVLDALQTIARADASVIMASEELFHEISMSFLDAINDTQLTREEWLARVSTIIAQKAEKAGMSPDQSDALVRLITYDAEGNYTKDSEAGRTAVAMMRSKLIDNEQNDFFVQYPDALLGLRTIVTRTFGFKTLDDVYSKLVAKDPTMTKDIVERLIVAGVDELLA